MYVSAGRAVGSVEVGVSVNPDQANFLILTAVELRDTGNGSSGNRMIATQSDWYFARFQRFYDEVRVLAASGGNFLQIFCVGIAFFFLFGDVDHSISRV